MTFISGAGLTPLNIRPWHDFAVASVGIAGALAGLIFVSLSLNLELVLKYPHLPSRARTALVILLGVAVANLCTLVPGQRALTFALEVWLIAVIAAVCAIQTARAMYKRRQADHPIRWTLQPFIVTMVPPLAWFMAGCVILINGNASMMAFATVAGVLVPVWEAWVLLIEIHR